MAEDICVARNPVDRQFYHARMQDIGSLKEAQLVMPEDITTSTVIAQVILDEVIGFAAPEQRLRNLCGVIRMPELVMSVDVGTLRTGSEKVPSMVEAELKANAYARTSFELWKNVDHIAFSDEAVKMAAHDIIRLATQNSGRVLAVMENSQISTILTGMTDQAAGGTWETKSGGVSTYDPVDDIAAAIATIEGYGYRPDQIAMHPTVWAGLVGNTSIKESVYAGLVKIGEKVSLPMFPELALTIDSALTATVCYIIDSKAPCVMLGDGPTEAERYRHATAGFTGFVVRQWLQPKIVLSTAGLEITGAHA